MNSPLCVCVALWAQRAYDELVRGVAPALVTSIILIIISVILALMMISMIILSVILAMTPHAEPAA